MNANEILKRIDENKENLPLSFYELNVKMREYPKISRKIVFSKEFKDSNFSIYRFYKPISRF